MVVWSGATPTIAGTIAVVSVMLLLIYGDHINSTINLLHYYSLTDCGYAHTCMCITHVQPKTKVIMIVKKNNALTKNTEMT